MGHVDLKVVLGILGNITAICLFTSPIPTFVKIVKQKSVGEFSGIPYVCTLLNCMLWVVYGLPIVEFQVLVVTINAAGCVIEFLYLALYLLNAEKKTRMKVTKVLLGVLIGFLAVTVLVLELVHDKKKRKVVIGTLCAVFAVGMYASPLTVMRMVVRTRSVKYMPFLLSLFNFVNGLVWFGYAFIGGVDVYIAIPNGLGALSGVAQLSLYAFYRNATPRADIEASDTSSAKGNNDHTKHNTNSMYVQMETKGSFPKHQQSNGTSAQP